jgi:threonine/homoserine/homoserine lactone efflux protein
VARAAAGTENLTHACTAHASSKELATIDALPSATTLALFTGATLALFVMPGPATLYLVARAIGQGRTAGLASAIAIATGDVVHVVAATAGLSALLIASAEAFTAVKLAGVAYLVWIGIRAWRAGDGPEGRVTVAARQSMAQVFREGFLVEVLNPKTALFFLAFVPQFVDPAHGAVWVQFLTLGITFVALSVAFCALLVTVASSARTLFEGTPRSRRTARMVTGGVFVGLGVMSALAGDPR